MFSEGFQEIGRYDEVRESSLERCCEGYSEFGNNYVVRYFEAISLQIDCYSCPTSSLFIV